MNKSPFAFCVGVIASSIIAYFIVVSANSTFTKIALAYGLIISIEIISSNQNH